MAQEHVRVAKYLVPLFGSKRMARVTNADIRSYRLDIERKDISLITLWHVLSDVRCLCCWAEDKDSSSARRSLGGCHVSSSGHPTG